MPNVEKHDNDNPLDLAKAKQGLSMGGFSPELKDVMQHVPIWYVFKSGQRININCEFLKIEDFSGDITRCRQQGRRRIARWRLLNQALPAALMSKPPVVVFYE